MVLYNERKISSLLHTKAIDQKKLSAPKKMVAWKVHVKKAVEVSVQNWAWNTGR